MTTRPGHESPNANQAGGDITVTRTILIPSGSIVITGTLTEADQIYRQLPKYLSQNGYKLATQSQTKTDTVVHGSSEVLFLRRRLMHLEELLGSHPEHQREQQLKRELIAMTEDRNVWMRSFIDLDAGMGDVLKTLEGGTAQHTIRECIAIQQLNDL